MWPSVIRITRNLLFLTDVSTLDRCSLALWQSCIHFFNMLGLTYHCVRDDINEDKQFLSSSYIVTKIYLTGMNGFVSNNPDNI